MVRSNEPLWWAPFFAGAGFTAMFLPATILIVLGTSLGWIDAHRLYGLANNPWVRLYLFVLISLGLFHAAHRIRFILIDFGLKSVREPVAMACYGGAIIGTILTALFALHVV